MSLLIAVQQRAGGHHFAIQTRVPAHLSPEKSAVPVGPIHHGCSAKAPGTGTIHGLVESLANFAICSGLGHNAIVNLRDVLRSFWSRVGTFIHFLLPNLLRVLPSVRRKANSDTRREESVFYIFAVHITDPNYRPEQYADAWVRVSEYIQAAPGARGTRLHRKIGDPATLLAIASWDSKADRDAMEANAPKEIAEIIATQTPHVRIEFIGEFEAPEWEVLPA